MSLRQAAFSAGRWTAGSAAVVSLLQLLQTVVLARLLLPSEFGLMAVAAAVLGVLSLMVDLGLSQALIHYHEVPARDRSSLYWVNVVLAIALMSVLIAAAPVLGRIYHSEALVAVLQWASLIFPLSAFGQQLRALAQKELRFAELAGIEIAATLVGFTVAVVFALLGAGVYALVAASLASAASSSALAWLLLPPRYRPSTRLRFPETRSYVRFGVYLVGESLVNSIRRDSDLFIGGLVLGPPAMGIYSVPRGLSLRLAMVINPIVTRVGFPVMARVKGDRERLKSIYLQTLRLTASVNFPIYVGLGLFADQIVALLYGAQWQEAGVYLRILAAWGLIRSTGNPVGSLLYAAGRVQRAFWWNLGLLLILPPLYWVAVWDFGLTGLASGMALIQLGVVLPAWRFLVRPCCGAGLGEFLRQFLVPLWIAIVAGLIAWLASRGLEHDSVRLTVGLVTGAASYLALSAAFNRRWIDAMSEFVRGARKRAEYNPLN